MEKTRAVLLVVEHSGRCGRWVSHIVGLSGGPMWRSGCFLEVGQGAIPSTGSPFGGRETNDQHHDSHLLSVPPRSHGGGWSRTFVSVGSRTGTCHVPGCEDYRSTGQPVWPTRRCTRS